MNKRLLSMLVIIVAVLASIYFMMSRNQNDTGLRKDARQNIESQKGKNSVPMESTGTQLTDKQTPLITEKELEPEIREAIQELVNTSSEGLAEEQTNKGVNVDLQGRFKTAPVATINEKGEVEIQDYTSPPGK